MSVILCTYIPPTWLDFGVLQCLQPIQYSFLFVLFSSWPTLLLV